MAILSDLFSFSDQVQFVVAALQTQVVVEDSFAFQDGLVYIVPESGGAVGDSVSFSDSVRTFLDSPKRKTVSDQLLFTDTLQFSISHEPTLTEAIAFVDRVVFFLAIIISQSDTLTFADDILTNLMVEIRVVCYDSFAFTDDLSSLAADLDYLRRYLNDKPGSSL